MSYPNYTFLPIIKGKFEINKTNCYQNGHKIDQMHRADPDLKGCTYTHTYACHDCRTAQTVIDRVNYPDA